MAGLVTEPAAQDLKSSLSAFPTFAQVASDGPTDARHWAGVGVGSAIVHIVLVILAVGVSRLPAPPRSALPQIVLEARPRQVTKLVAPPMDVLTQKTPNKGKVSQEFNLSSLTPRPAQPNVPVQPGAAALPRKTFQLPQSTTKPPEPKINVPDAPAPPAIDTAQLHTNLPTPALGNPSAPPPPPPTQEKPKLAFEKPGSMSGTPTGLARQPMQRPGASVDDAARQVMRGAGHGIIVGDEDAAAGASPSSPSVPLPGKLGSAVELLSDPQGVDFWPYLVKVLTTVRRNWFAVIPESARLGRTGRTIVQFAIARDGSVPKLVIASPAGADALDRAAVASISASNPFMPLPPEFKGSQIRLQFVFKYNMK